MVVIGEAFVAIRPDSQQFAADATKQLTPAAQSVAKQFATALGAAAVAAGVGRALLGGLQENDEAIKVANQTAAVLKSTGEAANVTADQVAELSDRLSEKIAVDNDTIQSSANVLLTFTKVRNEIGEGNAIFDRTVEVAQDMAAALGTDASGAAIQLGKALNDPVRGITALTRAGVTFTTQQREQIKAMVESGDILSAQRIILDELGTEFAGSAAAQATSLDRLTVAAGEAKEQLGAALEPALGLVARGATLAAEALGLLPAPLQTVLVAGAGIVAIARPINETIQLLRTLGVVQVAATGATALQATALEANAVAAGTDAAALGALGAVQGLYASSTSRAAAATALFTGALAKAAAAAFTVVPALTAVVAPYAVWSAASRDAADGTNQANQAIADFIERGNFNPNTSSFEEFRAEIDRVNAAGQTLQTEFANTGIAEGQLRQRINAATDALNPYAAQLGATAEAVARLAEEEGISTEAAYELLRSHEALIAVDVVQEAVDTAAAVQAMADAYNHARDALNDFIHEGQRSVDAGVAFRDSLRQIAEAGERIAGTPDVLDEVTGAVTSAGRAAIGGQERLDIFAHAISGAVGDVASLTDALIEQGTSASEVERRTNELVDQIFAAGEQAGLTADEVEFLRGQYGLLPDQVHLDIVTNTAYQTELMAAFRDVLNDSTASADELKLALASLGSVAVADVATGTRFGGPRATGGSVKAGRSYQIHEAGWEAFVPGVDGSMLSADRTAGLATRGDVAALAAAVAAAGRGGHDGGAMIGAVNIDARGLDEGAAGRLVGDQLLWSLRPQ